MKMIDQFTKLYPVSKTLRFKLIPEGKTAENFATDNILAEDEELFDNKEIVKGYMDRYHKKFISEILSNRDILDVSLVREYSDIYFKFDKTDSDRKNLKKIEIELRQQISKSFNKDERYKGLFKSEIIKNYLPSILSEEECQLTRKFESSTTYFTGFFKNRENMYSSEEKGTAIPFRCINQNLPKFLDNVKVFEKVSLALFESDIKELNKYFSKDNFELNDYFCVDAYGFFLSEKSIDEYNTVIGGYTTENCVKIKGINEYINLYNQSLKNGEKKLPKLKPLFKQILSDKESFSYVLSAINTDDELIKELNDFYSFINSEDTGLGVLCDIFLRLNQYDERRLYVSNGAMINDLSNKLTGNWNTYRIAWENEYDSIQKTKNKNSEKYVEKRNKAFKTIKNISFADVDEKLKAMSNGSTVMNYYSSAVLNSIARIKTSYLDMSDSLNNSKSNKIQNDKICVEKIKIFLDAIKELEWILKSLTGGSFEAEKDEIFYGEFIPVWETVNTVNGLYNKVRNYLTRKPYSNEKIKLNFGNTQLLVGWDLNKIRDCSGVILLRNGNYYLGIINKKSNNCFDDLNEYHGDDCYKKMELKYIPSPDKMLAKVGFADKNTKKFNPSKRVLEAYDRKGGQRTIDDERVLIDYYKYVISVYPGWERFTFNFKSTNEYNSLKDFCSDVESAAYNIQFKSVAASDIENLVEEGSLYLFRIYNKDFSKFSHGKPNLHTMYWRALFDNNNLNDVVYKLSGGAEVFYRKASLNISDTAVHKANEEIMKKSPENSGESSLFTYDIIKNKRYTVDQFQLNVPIVLNFKAKKSETDDINDKVNRALKCRDDFNVIGIDRGERNLLYISVVNSQGKILLQESLNTIINEYKGKAHKVDYHQLLDVKEKERMASRQSWTSIENIKDLKEGYLSCVIKRICDLVVEYDAVIAMEDLNSGFKNSRSKVEKSVYQKFEKMLVDKLNYLVFKDYDPFTCGGLMNAYQLTKKDGKSGAKQNGIIFYVPAWNTSKIDPVTGYIDIIKPKYKNISESIEFVNRFDCICYEHDDDMFRFDYDVRKFPKGDTFFKTHWSAYSNSDRIMTFRNPNKNNEWDCEVVNMTQYFKTLFGRYSIEYLSGDNLISEIMNIGQADFYKDFIRGMQLMFQMRNSKTGTNIDYMVSPVKNKSNKFYDSRNLMDKLPIDADANGAYNIARKCIWAIKKIKSCDNEHLNKVKLSITNKEWLEFVQRLDYDV